jgi:hypothetical protein
LLSDPFDSFNVYFSKKLNIVALGSEEKDRNPGMCQQRPYSADKVLLWLHQVKAVESIRQIWVSDIVCGGDSRIRSALWNPKTNSPLFSDIETFAWLAPNISIRTIEAVAPGVEHLVLLWDGCTEIVLEAWETDLKGNRLQQVRQQRYYRYQRHY